MIAARSPGTSAGQPPIQTGPPASWVDKAILDTAGRTGSLPTRQGPPPDFTPPHAGKDGKDGLRIGDRASQFNRRRRLGATLGLRAHAVGKEQAYVAHLFDHTAAGQESAADAALLLAAYVERPAVPTPGTAVLSRECLGACHAAAPPNWLAINRHPARLAFRAACLTLASARSAGRTSSCAV